MVRRSRQVVSITDAAEPASADLERRQRRYLALMAVRVACLLLMLVVPGWWRLVMLAGAAILPGVAVLIANNADRRTHTPPPSAPPAKQITSHVSGDVIRSDVAED